MLPFSKIYYSGRSYFREVAFHAACLSYWAYGANPSSNKAVRELMGLSTIDFIASDNALVPKMVVARDAHGVQIAIAGTTNLSQWLAYLTNLGVVNATLFNGQVFAIFDQLSDALKGQITPLVSRQDPMLLCGHSLGGALASIIASKLQIQGYNTRIVYTFGCPRVGDDDYANSAPGVHWHVRDALDIVPQLPPPIFSTPFARISGLPQLPFLFRNGVDLQLGIRVPSWLNVNDLAFPASPLTWANRLSEATLLTHAIGSYIAAIFERLGVAEVNAVASWLPIVRTAWGVQLAAARVA